MITTFYGLLLGTVVYGPFSEKIALEGEKSLELDLLVMEAIVGLKEKVQHSHERYCEHICQISPQPTAKRA